MPSHKSFVERRLHIRLKKINKVATDAENSASSAAQGYNIYTVGGNRLGFPELLCQEVPEEATTVVIQTFRALADAMIEGNLSLAVYTDLRWIVGQRHFRLVEVTTEAYRRNLILHVLTECQDLEARLLVLLPWYPEEMEDWATLPAPPDGQHARRDKILKAYFQDNDGGGDDDVDDSLESLYYRPGYSHAGSAGRWGQMSYYERHLRPEFQVLDIGDRRSNPAQDKNKIPVFSREDASFLVKHIRYFLCVLDLEHVHQFLPHMPEQLRRRIEAIWASSRRRGPRLLAPPTTLRRAGDHLDRVFPF